MKRLLAALLLAGSTVMLAAPPVRPERYAELPKAQEIARKLQRPVLLNFIGTGWCPYCKQMKSEVLTKKGYLAYASTNLVLVDLDFPDSDPDSKSISAANRALQERYKVMIFPTFLLVDASGKELGRHEGYLKGGVPAFTQKLDGWRTKFSAGTNSVSP